MSGWVFLAVLLVSFWETDCYQWDQIVSLTSKDQATFVLGVFGAIIGIGGPPAFGFLLEKVVSVILVGFKQNMWQYRAAQTFRKYFDDALKTTNRDPISTTDAAVMHTLFYTSADAKLLDWARRRRTHMYASFTAAASIVFALLLAGLKFNVWAFWTIITSIVLVVSLIIHGIRELRYHKQTVSAWIDIYGAKVSKETLASSSAAPNSSSNVAPVIEKNKL